MHFRLRLDDEQMKRLNAGELVEFQTRTPVAGDEMPRHVIQLLRDDVAKIEWSNQGSYVIEEPEPTNGSK